MIRSLRLSLLVVLVAGCAPRTGFLLEIDGPMNRTSTSAGITELRLIAAHHSYCERWVADADASLLRVDVTGRDLSADPVTILVTPVTETDLSDAVQATVLAFNASGQLVGAAGFDPHAFDYEQVLQYSARIALYGPGSVATGPKYLASDGCVCLPGRAEIGNSTGVGCDALIPPSFARYGDTAGCELPAGEALPVGVCDGQLYPGERPNRDIACYAARAGMCHVSPRICNDQGGLTVDRECSSADTTPSLPTGVLCDAFLACEQTACADALACMRRTVTTHRTAKCTLPVASTSANGAAQPCPGATWQIAGGPATLTGAACVGVMLDGTRVGPVTLGWKLDGTTDVQLISAQCPPTLVVSDVEGADPSALPKEITFSVTIGDEIVDVTLTIAVGCNGAEEDLQCDFT